MGRFWIDNELVDKHLCNISGNELKVWLTLSRHFDKYGKCFPSIRMMSKKLNLHHSTISNCLENLEKLGFLHIHKKQERMKLRLSFTKSARYLLPKKDYLLEKPDTKEVFKEVTKEKKKRYKGFEEMKESLKAKNPSQYEKLYGNKMF